MCVINLIYGRDEVVEGLMGMRRLPRVAVLLGSTMVSVIIIAASDGGYLEPWELAAYDLTLRFQPANERSTPPIVLIGITENDINTLARWPLTDDFMAKLLENIAIYQPHAIRVDI